VVVPSNGYQEFREMRKEGGEDRRGACKHPRYGVLSIIH